MSINSSRSAARLMLNKSSLALAPLAGSSRRSSGPSTLKLKPRCGLSICIDDTPRSASTMSKPPPASGSNSSMREKFMRRTLSCSGP